MPLFDVPGIDPEQVKEMMYLADASYSGNFILAEQYQWAALDSGNLFVEFDEELNNTFIDGVYEVPDAFSINLPGFGEVNIGGDAQASVFVKGNALTIAFRGSDKTTWWSELADLGLPAGDWLSGINFQYLNAFKPLLDAVEAYVAENSNVTEVNVVGHSLGGHAVNLLASDPRFDKANYYAFASPSITKNADAKVFNFGFDNDLVFTISRDPFDPTSDQDVSMVPNTVMLVDPDSTQLLGDVGKVHLPEYYKYAMEATFDTRFSPLSTKNSQYVFIDPASFFGPTVTYQGNTDVEHFFIGKRQIDDATLLQEFELLGEVVLRDVLATTSGIDYVETFEGNDLVYGSKGNDILLGGEGEVDGSSSQQFDTLTYTGLYAEFSEEDLKLRLDVVSSDVSSIFGGDSTAPLFLIESSNEWFDWASEFEIYRFADSAEITVDQETEDALDQEGILVDGLREATLRFDDTNGVTVDLATRGAGTVEEYAGPATFLDFLNVFGTDQNDIITVASENLGDGQTSHYYVNLNGEGGDDQVTGGDGADAISGGEGENILNGGKGADLLIANAGTNALNGGEGNDIYSVLDTADANTIILSGDFGRDMIDWNSAGAVDVVVFEGVTSSEVELYWDYSGGSFISGPAALVVNGNSLYIPNLLGDVRPAFDFFQIPFVLEFDDGPFFFDSVFGRPSEIAPRSIPPEALTAVDDFAAEREATDALNREIDGIIEGTEQADDLTGTDEADIVLAKGGDDLMNGVSKSNDIYDGGDGIDTLTFEGLTIVPVYANLEQGYARTSPFYGGSTGYFGDNTIRNTEIVLGGSGDDRLTGDAGDNGLSGGEGADQITGGKGNDYLAGGDDYDVDSFHFTTGDGLDTITDFQYGRDFIVIDDQIIHPWLDTVSQSGNDVIVQYGDGDQITLLGSDLFAWRTYSDPVISGSDADDIIEANNTYLVSSGFVDIYKEASSLEVGEYFDGKAGFDTLVYDFPSTLVQFLSTQPSRDFPGFYGPPVTVSFIDIDDLYSDGPLGVDKLVDIERVEFSDGVAIDITRSDGFVTLGINDADGSHGGTISLEETFHSFYIGSYLGSGLNDLDVEGVYDVDQLSRVGNHLHIETTRGELLTLDNYFDASVNHFVEALEFSGQYLTKQEILDLFADAAPPEILDQSIFYFENNEEGEVIGKVLATDDVEVVGFSIISGNENGYFAINNDGEVFLTALGVVAAANDFETLLNTFNLTVEVEDAVGNKSDAVITLDVQDVSEPINVVGTDAAETIDGTELDDTINGLGGSDTITAGEGDDVIDGGSGGDTINAGAGDDTVRGGTSWDTIHAGDGDDVVWGDNGSDTVHLDAGNDVFNDNTQTGTNGQDTVYGGTGNDVFNGGGGDDTFDGGADMDTLIGGIGNDTLTGGTEADTFAFTTGDGNDVITDFAFDEDVIEINGVAFDPTTPAAGVSVAQSGADTVISYGSGDTITLQTVVLSAWIDLLNPADGIVTGTGGNDVINSGTVVDPDGDTINDSGQTINGLGGSDTITAGAGDDVIDGGSGRDTINAGAGDDTVRGGTSWDTIHAGDGDDVVWGDNGSDTVYLDAGNDVFNDNTQTGTNGQDTVYGGTGNDVFNGGGGDDTFDGGADMDILIGGIGNDTLTGGTEADTFAFTAGDGNDVITDFAFDEDIIEINGVAFDPTTPAAGVSATQSGADTVISYGSGDTITLQSVDLSAWIDLLNPADGIVTGTGGNDVINSGTVVDPDGDTINDSGQTINSLGGNDTITAGAGDDVIDGGSGRDTINAGAGDDTVRGGTSWDTIHAGDGDDVVWGDNGSDTVYLDAGNDVFNDNTQTGRNGQDTVYGGTGNDVFNGGGGDDTFDGGADSDTILGGAGVDTLIGGIGSDTLTGGADADTFIFVDGDGSDTITDFEMSVDQLQVNGTLVSDSNLPLEFTVTQDGADVLIGYGTGDQIRIANSSVDDWTQEIRGTSGDDTLTGNAEDNIISGYDGNDVLQGLAGDDTITGGGGDDTITGGTGTNTVDAGSGNDTIFLEYDSGTFQGGTGNDVFQVLGSYDRNEIFTRTIEGGDGFDTLSYANNDNLFAGMSINTAVGVAVGYGAFSSKDYFTGIEKIVGSSGFDDFTGGAGDNEFAGLAGNDWFDAGGGTNILTGGLGADTFEFKADGGHHIIQDFQNGAGGVWDYLYSDTVDPYDITETVSGDDLLLEYEGGSILLVDGAGFLGDIYFDDSSSHPDFAPAW